MKCRTTAAAVASLCALALLAPATAGAQKAATSFSKIPVTGEAARGQSFAGTYTIDKFVTRRGTTHAVGTLKGKVGKRSVRKHGVAMPAALTSSRGARSAQAACPILTLVLGPLDLNLLGLRVQLNRVNLRITAVPGPGNLLGNLLCAVAGLLDGPQGSLQANQVTGLLNLLLVLVNNPSVGAMDAPAGVSAPPLPRG
jgi:hypothetical protein